jgi:hypothetical protein
MTGSDARQQKICVVWRKESEGPQLNVLNQSITDDHALQLASQYVECPP